jgi:hypothetical protein
MYIKMNQNKVLQRRYERFTTNQIPILLKLVVSIDDRHEVSNTFKRQPITLKRKARRVNVRTTNSKSDIHQKGSDMSEDNVSCIAPHQDIEAHQEPKQDIGQCQKVDVINLDEIEVADIRTNNKLDVFYEFLHLLISVKSPKVHLEQILAESSTLNQFSRLQYMNGVIQGVVVCTRCLNFFKFSKLTNGYGNLKRHLARCKNKQPFRSSEQNSGNSSGRNQPELKLPASV